MGPILEQKKNLNTQTLLGLNPDSLIGHPVDGLDGRWSGQNGAAITSVVRRGIHSVGRFGWLGECGWSGGCRQCCPKWAFAASCNGT